MAISFASNNAGGNTSALFANAATPAVAANNVARPASVGDLLDVLSELLPQEAQLCSQLLRTLAAAPEVNATPLGGCEGAIRAALLRFADSGGSAPPSADRGAARFQRRQSQAEALDGVRRRAEMWQAAEGVSLDVVPPARRIGQREHLGSLRLAPLEGALYRSPSIERLDGEDVWSDTANSMQLGVQSMALGDRSADAGCSPSNKAEAKDMGTTSTYVADAMSTAATQGFRRAVTAAGLQGLPWVPTSEYGGRMVRLFLLFEEPSISIGGKVVTAMLLMAIGVSILALVLESMPELRRQPPDCGLLKAAGLPLTAEACQPQPLPAFDTIEKVCVTCFTIDFLVRLFTCHSLLTGKEGALRRTVLYASRPVNVVDLLAILPFYLDSALELAQESNSSADRVLTVLRLSRILRLFKIARHHDGMHMFGEVVQKSGEPLLILVFFNVIIIILFGSLFYFVEGRRFSVAPEFTAPGDDGSPAPFPTGVYVRRNQANTADEVTPYRSIPYAVWYVCTTMTTVGYGDITPTTIEGKALGVCCFYVGILFLALPISVLGANFEEVYAEHLRSKHNVAQTLKDLLRREDQGETSRLSAQSQCTCPSEPEPRPWFRCYSLKELRLLPEAPRSRRHMLFLILEEPSSCRLGRWYSIAMLLSIIVSTISFIMESMPDFNYTPDTCNPAQPTVADCEPKPDASFAIIEVCCIVTFSIDYFLRISLVHVAHPEECSLTAGKGPVSSARLTFLYIVHPLNVIDLAAIVPFYVELFFPDTTHGGVSRILRLTRLVRVFRVLRMPKLRSCVGMFGCVLRDSLPALFVLFSMTGLTAVLFACCIFFAEGSQFSVDHFTDDYPDGVYIRPTLNGHDIQVSPFRSIPYSLWWFFVTACTVGYGDDFPTTTAGRFIGVANFYVGIVLLALPITIVGNKFNTHYPVWVRDVQAQSKSPPKRKRVTQRASQVALEAARFSQTSVAMRDSQISQVAEHSSRKAWG